MSWLEDKESVQAAAHEIDKSIKVYSKDNWYWRLYAKLPWLGRDFIEQTASVIGPLHFYPPNWHLDTVLKALHHEGRHTRQQRWFGLGIHPWVGFIPFALVSMLLLPAGLSVRFWLEMDAEATALKFKYKSGSNAAYVRNELIEFATRLAGPGYVWAWPKAWAIRIAVKWGNKIVGGK